MTLDTQRNFILGDSWLYYKIYTGPKTADLILSEIILPIAEQLVQSNIIDKWFFIRYADPKHHLRVRFHYTKPEHVGLIINALYPHFKEYVHQDLIWKLQIDTYQRELERYGSNTIDLGETLFYHDSVMIAKFVEMIEGDEGEELRWLFSLRAMDSFLDQFEYTLEEKRDLMINMSTSFRSEFDSSKFLGKQLNDKYRAEKDKIKEFMVFTAEDNPDYEPILDILDERETNTKPIIEKLLEHKNNETLQVNINSLMSSYIHMHMNRLFKSKNRMHEMVCYDFLCREYKTKVARMKHANK